MKVFNIGETITLFFDARNESGEAIRLNEYTKELILFTSSTRRIMPTIEDTGDSTFKISLSADDTVRLSTGTVSAVLTLRKDNEVRKGTACPFALQDPMRAGCTDRIGICCNEVNVSMCIEHSNIQIIIEAGQTIVDSTGGSGIVLSRWQDDMTHIAEALTVQGVPTEPSESGAVMGEKIRGLPIRPEGEVIQPPAMVSFPDLWVALYNNQRAGYEAMWGELYVPTWGEFALSGADAYLTSDGNFYETDANIIWSNPGLPNYVIYYKKEYSHNLSIGGAALTKKAVYLYKGLCTSMFTFDGIIMEMLAGKEYYFSSPINLNLRSKQIYTLHIENELDYIVGSEYMLTDSPLKYLHFKANRVKTNYFIRLTNVETLHVNVRIFEAASQGLFSNTGYRRIILPITTHIESSTSAFANNAALDFVDLPNVVVLGGTNMFGGTPNLKRFIIPNTPGGYIGDIWATCSIAFLGVEPGTSKPINLQSLITVTDRTWFRTNFIDNLGTTTAGHIIRLNATFQALLTAADIQAMVDKGYVVQFP